MLRILILFLLLFSCKESDRGPYQKATQPNHYSHDASLIDSEDTICSTPNPSKHDFIDIRQETSHNSHFLTSQTQEAIKLALSTVPFTLLDSFQKAGGSVVITDQFSILCPDSLFSCWKTNENQNPSVIVSSLEEGQIWATSYLQKSFLNSIGMIHIEVLESFTFTKEKSNSFKDPVFENFLISLSQEVSQDLNIPTYIESGADLYGVLFAEYFCSDQSRQNFNENAPRTQKLFTQIFSQQLELTASPRSGSILTNTRTHEIKKQNEIIRDQPQRIDIDFSGRGTIVTQRANERALETVKPQFQGHYKKLVEDHPRINTEAPGHYIEGTSNLDYTYNGLERFIYSSKTGNVRNIDNISGLNQEKPITIMVHGTKCSKGCVKTGKWAHPDSAMPVNLRSHYGGDVISFQWSGSVRDSERRKAGSVLAEEISYLRKEGFEVNLIGHSHGGNVIIEALNKAQENDPTFETKGEFVSLARPVRGDYKLKDKKLTSYFTAASGKGDIIQRLGGRFVGSGGRSDIFADLNIFFERNKSQHNKLKKALLEVVEQSAIERRTQRHASVTQPH
ncbi:MAG: hypothetical protein AB8C84_06745 [Oligoflexales bacterium]